MTRVACGAEDMGYSHEEACKLTQSQPQLLGMHPWHLKYCNHQIQVAPGTSTPRSSSPRGPAPSSRPLRAVCVTI